MFALILVILYLLLVTIATMVFDGIGLILSGGIGPLIFYFLFFYFIEVYSHKEEKEKLEKKNLQLKRRKLQEEQEEEERIRKMDEVLKKMEEGEDKPSEEGRSAIKKRPRRVDGMEKKGSYTGPREEYREPEYDDYNFNEDLEDLYENEIRDNDFPNDEWWG